MSEFLETPSHHLHEDLGVWTSSEMPLVSVVVPNYNHARFLPERFLSIRSQTFKDYELIVLDDASSDNSLEVIRNELSDLPHTLMTNDRNSGSPCSQWLKGIRQARGRYIWIAESDDSCPPTFLATILECMGQEVLLSYCRSSEIDANGIHISENSFYWPEAFDSKLWKKSFSISSDQFCRDFLTQGNVIPNASAVLFRRDQALKCQSIQPILSNFLFAGDWLFWLHYLTNSDGNVCYAPNAQSWFRSHSTTTRALSSDKAKASRHINEFCKVISMVSDYQPEQRLWKWPHQMLSPSWDWIFIEYIQRIKPSILEILIGHGLHGPLRLQFPFRLILSKPVHSHAFPRLFRLIYSACLTWRIRQAKAIGHIKRLLDYGKTR